MRAYSNRALSFGPLIQSIRENRLVLIICLMGIAASLVLFKRTNPSLDVFMFSAINDLSRTWSFLSEPIKLLGWLGGDSLWLLLVLSTTLLRQEPRERNTMLLLAAAAAASIVLVSVLKPLFGLPRPSQVLTSVNLVVEVPDTPTFPSGHTSMAFSMAMVVGWRHRRLLAPLLLLAFGTGFAMAYVGVHFVSDVVAGAFLGVAIGSTVRIFGKRQGL
jgi:undecaprenyl-diphosphatase